MNTVAVILAGGIGIRYGSEIPKQYQKINGKEVISYTIEAFLSVSSISTVLIMIDQSGYFENKIQNRYKVNAVHGGSTRQETISRAIEYINLHIPNADYVLFHDAVRPLITAREINSMLASIEKYDALFTAQKITDSVTTIDNFEYVNRSHYLLVQTPEIIKWSILREGYDMNSNATAIVHQTRGIVNMVPYYGFLHNPKITFPEDIFAIEQKLKYSFDVAPTIHPEIKGLFGNCLIVGKNGGVGKRLGDKLRELNAKYVSIGRSDYDLTNHDFKCFEDLFNQESFDTVFICAAETSRDEQGLISNYDRVFDANVRFSLSLLDFIGTLSRPVTIVFISSSSSTFGRKGFTLYSASKAALNSIVESMSDSLYRKNSSVVHLLIPEKINTPMISRLHGEVSSEEVLDPDYVVDALIHLATKRDKSIFWQLRKKHS